MTAAQRMPPPLCLLQRSPRPLPSGLLTSPLALLYAPLQCMHVFQHLHRSNGRLHSRCHCRPARTGRLPRR